MKLVITTALILLFGTGCGGSRNEIAPPLTPPRQGGETTRFPLLSEEGLGVVREVQERVDFSQVNQVFRFSAEIPSAWKIEYVPEIEAINIYDPAAPEENAREQSQIFIRYFEANDFLTLRTVDILDRVKTTLHDHPAVRYEIQKKPGVADFTQQPSWRNIRHTVVDVRMTNNNPSTFYVFAYNPASPPQEFADFLQRVQFHNDAASFISPLDRPAQRISKKPFGLYVTPENSPVQPERFSGYHNAVDFEVFEEEKNVPVEVRAFCGGPIREKRTAEGYGGVVVQECMIEDEVVTVVYGHLKVDPSPQPSPAGRGELEVSSPAERGELSTFPLPMGEGRVRDYLAPGDPIGLLGDGGTAETAGERKHLHFGIHKGASIDIRGYVTRESELDQWLDPWQYISTK